jgi:hypothetical protein
LLPRFKQLRNLRLLHRPNPLSDAQFAALEKALRDCSQITAVSFVQWTDPAAVSVWLPRLLRTLPLLRSLLLVRVCVPADGAPMVSLQCLLREHAAFLSPQLRDFKIMRPLPLPQRA